MKHVLPIYGKVLSQFGSLQWKLALSYIAVTAIALIASITVGLGVVTRHVIDQYPQTILATLRSSAPTVTGEVLNSKHSDPQELSDALTSIDYSALNVYINQDTGVVAAISSLSAYTVVTDLHGKILASSSNQVKPGQMLQSQWPDEGMRVFYAAAGGSAMTNQTTVVNAHMVIYAATILSTRKTGSIGVLVTRQVLPGWQTVLIGVFPLVWPAVLLLIISVSIIGILYSVLMSRWLIQRFKLVTRAADSWGRGDFSLIAWKHSDDEIGLMTRQLNIMAQKIEQLLGDRQSVAILEERNRLARDLHDSLKQQLFAITMQIWSAQVYLENDININGAQECLKTVERLLVQGQQELSSLIHQLRPVALAEKPFTLALREYCQRWSSEHNIPIELKIAEILLSLKAEEAFFRLTQEALSNIIRHSGATMVWLELATSQGQITLSIQDNGRGFNLQISERTGIGLHSMQERMESLGGSVTVNSTPGKGTHILAEYRPENRAL